MLKYIMIEATDQFICYRYFPEGKTEYGEIRVDKSSKEVVNHKLSPNDEFQWYFFKMYHKILDFINHDEFDESGMIAWY